MPNGLSSNDGPIHLGGCCGGGNQVEMVAHLLVPPTLRYVLAQVSHRGLQLQPLWRIPAAAVS